MLDIQRSLLVPASARCNGEKVSGDPRLVISESLIRIGIPIGYPQSHPKKGASNDSLTRRRNHTRANMQFVRESVLALATGAGAGVAASFMVARQVWLGAQAHGDLAEATADEFRKLRGERPDLPVPRLEIPSLYQLRLRRDISCAWNESLWSTYDTLRKKL